MKKIVIFDLDGTLVDSIVDLAEAVNYALCQRGYPQHDISQFNVMIGDGVKKLLMRALPIEKQNRTEVKLLAPYFFSYYGEHYMRNTAAYSGIDALLYQLKERGFLLGVASNKYDEATKNIVSTLFGGVGFDSVYGQREGIEVKPNPQIIFDILTDCKVDVDSTIYVGDSDVDIKTAKNAGVISVGVTWGFRSRQELSDAGANYIIDKPIELLSIL